MRLASLVLAVLALVVAMAMGIGRVDGVVAQRAEGDLATLLQHELAETAAMLEQLLGGETPTENDEEIQDGTGGVATFVVVESATPLLLSENEHELACLVAVQHVEEKTLLRMETQRLQRLRSPLLAQLVAMEGAGETRCEELVSAPLVAECERVVALEDDITRMLEDGKSHEQVCDVVRAMQDMAIVVEDTPLSCKLCKRFVQMVVQAIAQDMQQVQQVREILGDLCDSMSAESMCHTFLKQYDDVVNWLKHGTDSEVVCERLTMCTAPTINDNDLASAVVVSTQALTPAIGKAHGCCYCVQIVGVVEFVEQHAPAQLDNLHSGLKLLCKFAPKSCKCNEIVGNFTKIVDWTKHGKTPVEICQALGTCKKSSDTSFSKMMQLAQNPAVAQKMASLLVVSSPNSVNDDKTCFYCDYFTTLLEVAIQEDPTDMDDVRQYADMICGMLGDSNLCHQYVDKLDFVVDELKKGTKPRDICIQLKFCPKPPSVRAPVRDDKKCFYCDYFVTLLEIALQEDGQDIEELRQFGDMICGMLGDQNMCHQYMDKFDAAVHALKQGKRPHEICTEFQFCQKAMPVIALPAVVKGENQSCFYCDYFSTLVEVVAQESSSELDEIRAYADIVCGMLGESNSCHQYVDKFDYVVDSLKAGKKPREICSDLKFCSKKIARESKPAVLDTTSILAHVMVKSVTAPNVKSIDSCFFCTQVSSLFKVAVVQQPAKVDEIRNIADLICNIMPADNKCHTVMRNIDQIIDSIKKGEEPGAICHDMNFCPKKSLYPALPDNGHPHDNVCAYCDGVATILGYALKTKPDQVQEIREAAGIVCDFMPADDKCHDDLKMFDRAVALLKGGKSPHDVCADLKFCNSSSTVSASKLTPLSISNLDRLDSKSHSKSVEKSLSVGCLLCEYTAELITVIKGDANKLRLAKEALSTMCVVLPPSARCDVLTSKFDELAQLIGEGKSPSAACNTVSLCGDNASFVASSTERTQLDGLVALQ